MGPRIGLQDRRFSQQPLYDLSDCNREGPFDGTAAGAYVTAPPERFGHFRNIHFALAPKTDPVPGIRKFSKKNRNLYLSHGKSIID
jgi:hypothetical protein